MRGRNVRACFCKATTRGWPGNRHSQGEGPSAFCPAEAQAQTAPSGTGEKEPQDKMMFLRITCPGPQGLTWLRVAFLSTSLAGFFKDGGGGEHLQAPRRMNMEQALPLARPGA